MTNVLFSFYLFYCLISAMFVDIGANHSVIDRVKLSYIYDEIDSYEVRSHCLYVRFD